MTNPTIFAIQVVFDPRQVARHLPETVEVEHVEIGPDKERIVWPESRPTDVNDVVRYGRQTVLATDPAAAIDAALRNLRDFTGKPGLTLMGSVTVLGEYGDAALAS